MKLGSADIRAFLSDTPKPTVDAELECAPLTCRLHQSAACTGSALQRSRHDIEHDRCTARCAIHIRSSVCVQRGVRPRLCASTLSLEQLLRLSRGLCCLSVRVAMEKEPGFFSGGGTLSHSLMRGARCASECCSRRSALRGSMRAPAHTAADYLPKWIVSAGSHARR